MDFAAAGVSLDCMQARAGPYLSEAGKTAVMPAPDVLILYEDLGTGLRAKHALDLLPDHFPADARCSTKLWRLELLSDPLLAEQAALEAAAADVIIMSVHGRRELPAEARRWLNGWLAHKEPRPYALGVLLDSREVNQGSENPVIRYMEQVACAAGADLFYGFSEAPASELDSALEEIDQRAHRSSAVLEDMLKRVTPHRWWGINE
jgi:hypothetical protein